MGIRFHSPLDGAARVSPVLRFLLVILRLPRAGTERSSIPHHERLLAQRRVRALAVIPVIKRTPRVPSPEKFSPPETPGLVASSGFDGRG
jgi:hypothetical protein